MFNFLKKIKELENRVQEVEVRQIAQTIQIKAAHKILYDYFHKENSNGTDKDGKIKTKKSSRKRDNR